MSPAVRNQMQSMGQDSLPRLENETWVYCSHGTGQNPVSEVLLNTRDWMALLSGDKHLASLLCSVCVGGGHKNLFFTIKIYFFFTQKHSAFNF